MFEIALGIGGIAIALWIAWLFMPFSEEQERELRRMQAEPDELRRRGW